MEWFLLIPPTVAAFLLYVLFKPPVHPGHAEYDEEAAAVPVSVLEEENARAVATVHSAPIHAGEMADK